ncbi:hypothetical protein DFH07DRAFT_960727 [Mycena maculata]|uniref:Uncharacterized protein n=1 Tax=Mycena maculata TaxID=230809 RepID=A0AAD7IZT0_9AGAR|nr:hypothetical protein DFH07DRAFT_960727 [Mycena maculata]
MADSEEEEFNRLLNRPSSPVCGPPELPPTSSPTGLSSSANEGGSDPPSSSAFICPSIAPVATNPLKRPAEDLTQLASTVARKIKLNSDDRDAMVRYAKATPEEQRLLTFGQLLKVGSQLAFIHPSDALYTVTPLLRGKIRKHCARSMLCPTIPSYREDDAIKQVTRILLKYPSWGYTKAIKNDSVKSKIVNKVITKDLTDLRFDIKKAIGDSVWLPTPPKEKRAFVKRDLSQDIISLCETLVALPSVKSALVPVTFDMLGRVAILRALLIIHPKEPLYWEKVDNRLEKIRTNAKNDRGEISKSVGKILKSDQDAHGSVDVEPYQAAAVGPPAEDDDSDGEVTALT